jgi:peptide-methionine (S)-S-oxide reductase
MFSSLFSPKMPAPDKALKGRPDAITTPPPHYISGRSLVPPYPAGFRVATFGLGCFWGAEKTFWETPGVWVTAVGYAGGYTPNPTYEEACSGRTGHAEVVRVVYDPAKVSYEELLRVFWEDHNPTQGMRQGNDLGTQYRSLILVEDEEQRRAAEASRAMYAKQLENAGFGEVTTEIVDAGPFYFAEDYHQQYLAKVPNGYCPNNSTGVKLPEDFTVTPLEYVD